MSTATPPFRTDFRKGDRRPVEAGELAKLFERLPPHALEAEAALLGSMILDFRMCGEVLEILKDEEDFFKPAHSAIYKAIIQLYDQQQSLDVVQLTQKLKDQALLDQTGGVDYLIELAESVPSATSAAHYARIVRDKAVLRRLIDAAGKIIYDAYHTADPAADQLDVAEQAVFKLADTKSSDSASLLYDLANEVYQQLQDSDGRPITGLETGFYELDEMSNGFQNGEMIIVAARPSMGKAQPLDAKVLTPRGWTSMGELRVGDALASIDGQPSAVAGIFPQGERQVYRVTFADGRSTECCAEHLWRVNYRGWDAPRVVSTQQLITMLGRKRYDNRLWIETFSGEFGDDDALPLDPWWLGNWMGEGSALGCHGPSGRGETSGAIRHGLQGRGTLSIAAHPIETALQDLGLWGCDATAVCIPESYMTASRRSRAQLLQGLIDGCAAVDSEPTGQIGAFRRPANPHLAWRGFAAGPILPRGGGGESGHSEAAVVSSPSQGEDSFATSVAKQVRVRVSSDSLCFATVSKQLARDVVALTRSLGGVGSYCRKQCAGLPMYVCTLRATRDDPQHPMRLEITAIEPTRIVQTQCIAVTHPSRLYVTDDYIVTHNTAFALNIAEHMGATNKQPVAVFSLEMSKQQLAQRLMCSRSGIDSHKLRRNMLSGDEFAKLSLVVGELQEAPIYIDDSPGLTLLQLRAKARRLAARHHIKAIFIDYLQLMSQPGAESRQQEVSNISRGIKALARELSVPVVCLSQLNRASESREGHRPRMSDLRESGSIEQDADVVIMLHREDYYHKGEDEYEDTNVAEVIMAKQRNGPTGTVKLQFNGGTTRFNNLAPGSHSHGGGGY